MNNQENQVMNNQENQVMEFEMPQDLLLDKYLEVKEKYDEYFGDYPETEMGEYIFTFYTVGESNMMNILEELDEWLDEQLEEEE